MTKVRFAWDGRMTDHAAAFYSTLNEDNLKTINQLLGDKFKKYQVKTTFDLTCGAGFRYMEVLKIHLILLNVLFQRDVEGEGYMMIKRSSTQ